MEFDKECAKDDDKDFDKDGGEKIDKDFDNMVRNILGVW